jgi:hydrogenase maturation protease
VFVVDAISSNFRPGAILRLNATHQSLQRRIFQDSSHSFGLHEAIELARVLNRLPRRLIIYGIEGKSFDLGAEVSSEAKVAASRVVKCMVAELTPRCAISENHQALKKHVGT